MKTLTTILVSMFALVAFATVAQAQEDDGDMFGEETTDPSEDGSGDGIEETQDDGSDSGDDSGAEAAVVEDAPSPAGGVGKNSGTLGLGFTTTTTNLSGVEAEYWLSPNLAAAGIARISYASGEMDSSLLSFQFGAGAFFALKDRGKSALLFGGRFLVGYGSFDPGAGDSVSSTSIALEAPLRLQMALHPNISAHLEGGVAILIGDQGGFGGDPDTTFGFGIGTNNLYGAAGLTFYLD